MKPLVLATIGICWLVSSSLTAEQLSVEEIHRMDTVATMMGSLDKWINGAPEIAITTINQAEQMLAYADRKIKKYEGMTGRAATRVAQLKYARKTLPQSIERFQQSAPQQIESALKRVEREVERMRSKRPNLRMFHSMVSTSMPRARGHLAILKALKTVDPTLLARFNAVEEQIAMIREAHAEELIPLNRAPRDRYRQDDKSYVTTEVEKRWAEAHPAHAVRSIILPETNWERIYGAVWNHDAQRFDDMIYDSIPAFVNTELKDGVSRLHPIKIRRPRGEAGPISISSSSDVPIDVLTAKIR